MCEKGDCFAALLFGFCLGFRVMREKGGGLLCCFNFLFYFFLGVSEPEGGHESLVFPGKARRR
jgi:hypothetical protein